MYCIRHDEPGTYGWQVQVPRTPERVLRRLKARRRAAAFRKARHRVAELADDSKVNLKTRRFVRCRGASDGVFRIKVRGYAFWVAAW